MVKFYLKLNVCLAILLLLGSSAAFAQSKTVTGKVTSSDDGSPLPGVNILEKGTTNGTVTDANGAYSISVQENATLIFSFIGYAAQEVSAQSRTTVDITLQTDVTALSEVVVIGYGQVEKKDATGSVIALGTKDFNRGVVSSPQDLMVGRLAGVQVTSGGGAPGTGSTIRIRGGSSALANNDPLIVVDGFPLDNTGVAGSANGLASINPNDIETFTVLKDASATAIYGSRASNGVIIITTKKGKEGKPQLNYNGNYSISTPIKYVDVLSATEFKALASELAAQNAVGLDADALTRLGNANTDWQKEIFQNAFTQDHNLSLSGTAKSLPYRVSYGYTDQQGILKTTDYKRQSVNLSLTPSLLDDHLKVNASFKGSYTKQNFGNTGAIGAAVAYDPTQPVRNGNTRFGGYHTWVNKSDTLADGSIDINGYPNPIGTSNPVALLNQTDNRSSIYRGIGNIQLNYTLPFLPELTANINAGFDHTKSTGFNNAPDEAAWTYRSGIGQKQDYTANNHSELLDFYLNYKKELGASKIEATGGYSYQTFSRNGTAFNRNGDGTVVSLAGKDKDGKDVPYHNPSDPNTLISFFGRLNYTLKDKYLLTATLRNDISSRFSKDNRSGLFPAVAFAWKIGQESFLVNSKTVSDLKLRLGYGITGQQDVGGTYPYLPLYTISQSTAQYQFGDTFYNTLRPLPYDANFKWEETTTYNVGVDFGLIGDRITGTVDVYDRKTTDLINRIPIAAGSNFSNYLLTNVGDLENKGYEITLRAKAVSTADFTWNIGFNYTHNENKITKLAKITVPGDEGVATGGIAGGVGNNIQIFTIGYPSNSFYVYEQVYNDNGKPIEGLYTDKTSSVASNKYHYHSPIAKVLMGLNSSLTYKKFDFAFSGRFSIGNYVYNNVFSERARYSSIYNQSGYFNNLPKAINDTKFTNPQYFSDYYVENASFFKMDNMSLGYSVGKLFTQKLKARFSFTVRNAFIVTKYKGLDPEVFNGIDNNIYPRPRTFLIGVNLTY